MKTLGELRQYDDIYAIIVGRYKIEIKKAYVYAIPSDKKTITVSIPNRISERIESIWPPKNVTSCSPDFTSSYNEYFSTSLEEAKSIKKKLYADKIKKAEDKIKKLETDISNAKELKCKLENYYKSID